MSFVISLVFSWLYFLWSSDAVDKSEAEVMNVARTKTMIGGKPILVKCWITWRASRIYIKLWTSELGKMCPIIWQIKKLQPSKLANKTSRAGVKENLQFVTFQEITS